MKKQKIVLSQLKNETVPFDSASMFAERSNTQTAAAQVYVVVAAGVYVAAVIVDKTVTWLFS